MDAALVELVRRALITEEEAERRSSNPDELRRLAGAKIPVTGAGRGGEPNGAYTRIRR
jgi:hypothetical protein